MSNTATVSRSKSRSQRGQTRRHAARGVSARSACVKLWLSPEEHAVIAGAANRIGVSAASFVRETAIGKALGFRCLTLPSIDTAEDKARNGENG